MTRTEVRADPSLAEFKKRPRAFPCAVLLHNTSTARLTPSLSCAATADGAQASCKIIPEQSTHEIDLPQRHASDCKSRRTIRSTLARDGPISAAAEQNPIAGSATVSPSIASSPNLVV
jgi:hypothetical protein